jgi:F-type H+-transporting ATPase subunit b
LKVQLRIWLAILFLTASLGWQGGAAAYAVGETASPQAGTTSNAPEHKQDSEDTSEFRHADNVKAIAHMLGIPTETAAQIFEWLNSGILIFTILFFLTKVVPKAIRGRTATIQTKLIEARQATEIANERLTAVEAKLARIGEDIEAIRLQTERDLVEDEKRIKQSLEDERQRIVKASEQEIESAGAAAKRDLKRFAAELAVDNAAKRIQLTYESDKAIVERFGQDLTSQFGKGGQN